MDEIPSAPLATPELDDDNLSTASVKADTRCGYRGWRPNCLQKLNKPAVLVFCIATYSLSLGFVVNGIINVNASSIERRFDLQSTDIGFISSSYDITAAFLALLAGYFGSGQRKARMLALAMFCSAVGSLVLSSPHFLTDKYSLGLELPDFVCHKSQSSNETCSSENGRSFLSNYFYVFLAGQLLHGVGGTTTFTVGISLIDDCVMPDRTPFFLGIVYGCNILGAGLGYTIGGQLLNIYVDFDSVSDINLAPGDQRWVGAWWLGPLLSAIVQIVCAIAISLFGSELPSCKKVRQLRQNQAHMTSSMHLSAKLGGLRFLNATCRLLKNPCFVFVTLAMVMEGMNLTGLAVFLPKYIENQFGVTAAYAALLAGLAVIPAAAGGMVLGGWVAKHFNLDISQSIKMIIGLAALSGLCSSFIWIRCDQKSIYGVHRDFTGSSISSGSSKSLISPCNAMCNCNTDVFEPVCDNSSNLFFSPCFAGCSGKKDDKYIDCSCMAAVTLNDTDVVSSNRFTLTTDSCTEPCSLLYVFIALLFFTLCLCFIPIAPGDAIQLRCVHEDYKTHAQGVKTFIVRTLGSFVGPIVVGKLLDLNCNVWRKKCGLTLSCWLYDQDMLVTYLYIFILICKSGSIIFCSLALKFYQPPRERNRGETVEQCLDIAISNEVAELRLQKSEDNTDAKNDDGDGGGGGGAGGGKDLRKEDGIGREDGMGVALLEKMKVTLSNQIGLMNQQEVIKDSEL